MVVRLLSCLVTIWWYVLVALALLYKTTVAQQLNMKALISGGNGFIGTHLRHALKNKDVEVIAVPRETLQNPYSLNHFVLRANPDFIFHLSAYGNHYFQTDERQAIKTNVYGLVNLIEASRLVDYRAFVNFSTTDHNLQSGSFYGSTKAAGEYLVRAYINKYDLPMVNIRPYSVYGEYEWSFRFIPTIANKIRKGEQITVSDVTHDWIYVEDFIQGLLYAVDNIDTLQGKAVSIGTGTRINNLDVAKTLMKITGITVAIEKGVKREYEIPAYNKKVIEKTASEKNEVELFQFAKTSLEEGLRKVYENPHLYLRRHGDTE